MVALNTEPLGNPHYHIGELQLYSLSELGEVSPAPLCSLRFNPVPIKEGRFFNQCIQKKGNKLFSNNCSLIFLFSFDFVLAEIKKKKFFLKEIFTTVNYEHMVSWEGTEFVSNNYLVQVSPTLTTNMLLLLLVDVRVVLYLV